MHLYTDVDAVPWATLNEGAWLRAAAGPWIRDGLRAAVANASGAMALLVDGPLALPVIVPEVGACPTWTVSPRTAFVNYAAEELGEVDGALLRRGLGGALAGLGAVLDAGDLDRVVLVDDLALSTMLHVPLDASTVRRVDDALIAAFPDRAIVWRSLHRWGDHALDGLLADLGLVAVPSRSVWMWDPARPAHRRGRDLKRDARLARWHGYTVFGPEGLADGDVPRLRHLYDLLYLDKYSALNPAFTDAFVRAALDGALVVRALQRAGRIDGVVGFYVRNGQMTTPLLGYDTTVPQEVGLYRMCSAILVHEAIERGLILHQSAGAASFKRNRRAENALEVMRVEARHLPWRRRVAWRVLSEAMGRIAAPLVARLGL